MKRKKLRAWLALALTICLCTSLLSPVAAVQTPAAAETEEETAVQSADYTYGNSLRELIGQQFADQLQEYDPDEIVSVIVQLDAPALMDEECQTMLLSDGDAIADVDAETLSMAQEAVEEIQQEVKEQISQVADEASFENSENFTLLINAFTVEVPYSEVSQIRSLDGVKDVFINGSFSIPETTSGYEIYTDSSSNMIGMDEPGMEDLTGAGTVIAILDTGIEYSHEAFATAPSELRYTQEEMKALVTEKGDLLQAKLSDGWDMTTWEQLFKNISADELMISDKIIYSFDYANVDYDATADAGEHGIHVAGIAAGHTVASDGTTTFSGVAPDAQLAVMKVFNTWSGSCTTTTLLSALEDCVLLDVDVINMSLGTASGFTTDISGILSDVMQKIEDAGIILAVAAGNDTNTAANNPLNDAGLPQVENPDNGLVSSPSTYHAALSVASVNNTKALTSYLMVNGEKISYTDTQSAVLPITGIGSLEVAAVPGVGEASDYEGLNVTGKAVLVQRGSISFADKLSNAAANGASAILVYDNVDSNTMFGMDLNGSVPQIPSASILKADGEAILEMLENGETVILTASEEFSDFIAYPDAGMMSSFSSWGATSALTIKPEITAPGGNVYSSVANNQYESMSGTSMASPEIAGAAAVLVQYLKQQDPTLSKTERATLIHGLMMSTADPVEAENGLPASVRQQGAGLVNVKSAVSTQAVLFADGQGSRPKAELGDREDGVYQFTFVLENLSDETLYYGADVSVLTDTATTIDGTSYYVGVPQDIGDGAVVSVTASGSLLLGDVNFDGTVDSSDARAIRRHVSGADVLTGNALLVSDVNGDGVVSNTDASLILQMLVGLAELPETLLGVAAGDSLMVSVSIALTAAQITALEKEFPCGAFVEGYVTLHGFCGNEDLSYPYLGFLGDWEDQQLFDSTYYDDEDPMVYDGYLVGIDAWTGSGNYLGFNYFTQSFDADKLYFSSTAFGTGRTRLYSEISLLRNAQDVTFTVANADTGETLYTTELASAGRTYYSASGATFVNVGDPIFGGGYDPVFTWPEEDGHLLYTVSATHEGDESGTVQTLTFPVITMDETAPTFTYDLAYNEASGTYELTLHMQDNGHIQGARISGIRPVNQWFSEVVEVACASGETITETAPNTTVDEVIQLPDLQKVLAENGCELDQLVIEVVDYAWNVTELEITLSGSHFTTADNGDGTVTITGYAGAATEDTVPAEIDGKTVTAIGDNAFAGSILSSVTLPDTLTTIGAGAFQGTNLTWIKVPGSVTSIGEKAFGYDADGNKIDGFTMCVMVGSAAETYAIENGFAMEYITEDGMLYEIVEDEAGDYISVIGYDGTSGVLNIPASIHGIPVEEIGYRAFFQNEVLTEVTLPEGLKRIGDRAFMYTNVGNMTLPSTLEVIEEGAFSQMVNLTAVEVPASVKELPYMVFANDTNLVSVTLHEGLETLGGDVFYGCGLTEIVLPDSLTQVGQSVFQNCTNLTKATLPSGMTTIPSGFFFNTGFTELVIPDGITTIESTAYAECKNLTSVTIPASVVTLGQQWGSGAFHDCINLTEVNFTGERTELLMVGGGTFEMCTSLSQITLPDCSYIGYAAFLGTALTSIEIPATCTEIGGQVFYMCNSLSEIILHEGLTTVGFQAFSCGPVATEVTIPRSVTSIGSIAFGYLNWSEKLDNFTIRGYAGTAAETYAEENGFTFVAISEEP